jgi:hypothetical protein
VEHGKHAFKAVTQAGSGGHQPPTRRNHPTRGRPGATAGPTRQPPVVFFFFFCCHRQVPRSPQLPCGTCDRITCSAAAAWLGRKPGGKKSGKRKGKAKAREERIWREKRGRGRGASAPLPRAREQSGERGEKSISTSARATRLAPPALALLPRRGKGTGPPVCCGVGPFLGRFCATAGRAGRLPAGVALGPTSPGFFFFFLIDSFL